MAIGKLNIAYLVAVIGAVSLPTVTAVTYHKVTKDPRMKPLAITSDTVAAFSGDPEDLPLITVVIDWAEHENRDIATTQLSNAILRAFQSKGIEATILLRPSDRTRITYYVGASVIGPYPRSRAAEGIRPAADAAHMLEARQRD